MGSNLVTIYQSGFFCEQKFFWTVAQQSSSQIKYSCAVTTALQNVFNQNVSMNELQWIDLNCKKIGKHKRNPIGIICFFAEHPSVILQRLLSI